MMPRMGSVTLQICVLTLVCAAALWGGFCIYGAAFPGPCGDNPGPGLGVIESWVLDMPVGLLGLIVGWLVKRGSLGLRRICFSVSPLVLVMPIVASAFLQRSHCP
jgi:hypothetical protein